MWENGVSLEYFHASEDRQVTRDKVFEVIKNYLSLYRKWERGDHRSYDIIKESVKSEFDVFRGGSINYY